MSSRNPSSRSNPSHSTALAPPPPRKFLHPHLSRRPTAAGPAVVSTSSSVANNSRSRDQPAHDSVFTPHNDSAEDITIRDDADDIILRDEHGNYKLDTPIATPNPKDELRDEKENEDKIIEEYRKHQLQMDPTGEASCHNGVVVEERNRESLALTVEQNYKQCCKKVF